MRLALVRGDAEAAALDATYDPLLADDQPVSLSGLLEDELILAMPNFCRHPRGECEMPCGENAVERGEQSGERQDADTAGESGKENPFSALEPLKSQKTL